MLDTHGRKWIQPIINKISVIFIKLKMSPIKLTVFALLLGITAAFMNAISAPIMALIFLWLSGLMDVLDGTVARMTNKKSDLGAFLDITFDRIVELSILYSFVIRDQQLLFIAFILATTFVLSITVFLTVASLTKNNSEKAFYYQAGITERTETFIFFSLMILFNSQAQIIGLIFAALVGITIVTRIKEAINIFNQ